MAKKLFPLGKVGYKNTKQAKDDEVLQELQEAWPSRLEFSPLEIILNAIAVLFMLGTVIWALASYSSLPAEIPMHYDIHGQVDDYGSKTNIFMLLAFDVLCVAGMAACSIFPRTFNIPVMFLKKRTIDEILHATRLYLGVTNMGTAMIFFYLTACIIMGWQLSTGMMMGLLALILLPMVPYFIYLSR